MFITRDNIHKALELFTPKVGHYLCLMKDRHRIELLGGEQITRASDRLKRLSDIAGQRNLRRTQWTVDRSVLDIDGQFIDVAAEDDELLRCCLSP